jgi:hypothetical protein
MGESCNFMQKLQLLEGGQNPRRGRNDSMAKIERNIMTYLLELFVMDEVVIKKGDLRKWGVDESVASLVLGDFSQIIVEEELVRVEYSDYIG